jgi:hypothetical protein
MVMSDRITSSTENRVQQGSFHPRDAVFGNALSPSEVKKIAQWRQRLIRKFNYDPDEKYTLGLVENEKLGPFFGVKNIVRSDESTPIDPERAVVCATTRSGYGLHRGSIAIASCAHYLELQPYWLDLTTIQGVPQDMMRWRNNEYSRLSRFSQRSKFFDRFVWEPHTSGERTLPGISWIIDALPSLWSWKHLKGNVRDFNSSQLFANLFAALPSDLPVMATHVYAAQAAVAAGMTNVFNLILDNWPVALWLAEGAQHYVQSPSAYYGYRTMSGFTIDDRILQPIPADYIHYVGHFIDHELVSNVERDCADRLSRASTGEPRRFLISIGGAGAQESLFKAVIDYLAPYIESNHAALFVNLGDHRQHWDWLLQQLGSHRNLFQTHFTWESTMELVEAIRTKTVTGIHIFLYEDIFHAVYATNYLMRVSDVLITKPSELAFYPIPKILNKRVGGHEAWGAIRSAEIGDGTTETRTIAQTLNAIDLLMKEEDLLRLFCDFIVKNKSIGIYDGAYKVCELAKDKRSQ